MANPKVCILVLNWNGASDTIECLDSLHKLTYSHVEVVVIDNGSDDDSISRIRQAYPEIELLELPKNLLYGGGNNAGLEWIKSRGFDYVIFLNNDTTVEPEFIEPLLTAFKSESQIGIVAPLMCYATHPDLVWYGGGRVNLWTGVVAHQHIRKHVDTLESSRRETDYVTGCCLMMPTKLALELKGFDPAFEMYGEDVDLSLRCRKDGYRLIFVPESRLYHKVSASLGGEFSYRKLRRKLKGMIQLFRRHARWYQWMTIGVSQLIKSLVYLVTYLRHHSAGETKS